MNPDDRINVACVCGNEVRIYSSLERGATVRALLAVKQFPHYGAAKMYADEYEDHQRKFTSK